MEESPASGALPAGRPEEWEQLLVRMEEEGRLAAALDLCDRILAEHRFAPGDAAAERQETQFRQRRLRLRRKLRLPTWSSQGTPY
jgi:hypothetical protein